MEGKIVLTEGGHLPNVLMPGSATASYYQEHNYFVVPAVFSPRLVGFSLCRGFPCRLGAFITSRQASARMSSCYRAHKQTELITGQQCQVKRSRLDRSFFLQKLGGLSPSTTGNQIKMKLSTELRQRHSE